MKKLLLGICCLFCAVGMIGMSPKEIGKPEEKKQEQKKDILEEMGVAKDAKFFIQFKGNQIKISRAGVMRCSYFMRLLEAPDEDAIEFDLPWMLQKIGSNALKIQLTVKDLESFVAIVENKPDYSKLSEKDLCVFINLANYAQSASFPDGYQSDRNILQELVNELKTRLKKLKDEDYKNFLRGTGFLRDVVHMVPTDVLDEYCVQAIPVWSAHGKFKAELRDGRLVLNVYQSGIEFTEVWKIGGKKSEWSTKGVFREELLNGRLVLIIDRHGSFFTEEWKIDGNKPEWSAPGLFGAKLQNGRMVLNVCRENTSFIEVWKTGSKQSEWFAPGEFVAELQDGRLVLDVYRDFTHFTEVWKIGGKKPEWSAHGDFKTELQYDRLVLTVERDGLYFTEVWKIGSEQAEWSVSGLFEAKLQDDRLVLRVKREGTSFIEVWNIGSEQAEWSMNRPGVRSIFVKKLLDGRLALNFSGPSGEQVEIWKIGDKKAEWSGDGIIMAVLSGDRVVLDTNGFTSIIKRGETFTERVLMHALQTIPSDEPRLMIKHLLDELEKEIQDKNYFDNTQEISFRLYIIEELLKSLTLPDQEQNKDLLVKRLKTLSDEIELMRKLRDHKNEKNEKNEKFE